MPADLKPIAIRPQMVGVMDHPGGQPQQFLLDRREIFQLAQFRLDRPHFVHAGRLVQSAGHGNHSFHDRRRIARKTNAAAKFRAAADFYWVRAFAITEATTPLATAIITYWPPFCTHS